MRKFLPWLACAAIAVVGVPTLAWGQGDEGKAVAPADASFHTGDNFFQDDAGAADDSTVQIAVGGTVTFKSRLNDSTNAAPHNVIFNDESPKPSVCNQTVQSPELPGTPLDADGVEPMPSFASPPGWEGYCTFNTPGTYTFFCSAHGQEMHGTVVVGGSATPTPTPTPTSTPTATPTPTPTPTATPTNTPTPTPTATPRPHRQRQRRRQSPRPARGSPRTTRRRRTGGRTRPRPVTPMPASRSRSATGSRSTIRP